MDTDLMTIRMKMATQEEAVALLLSLTFTAQPSPPALVLLSGRGCLGEVGGIIEVGVGGVELQQPNAGINPCTKTEISRPCSLFSICNAENACKAITPAICTAQDKKTRSTFQV